MFLVGVHLLTANLEQSATGRIRDLFRRIADNKPVNLGIGAATTALIQSSGVTTVLIVGFVNVGVMNLEQATAMIMGANIGTTVTAQIAALSAFPVTTYLQLLSFVGVFTTMVARGDNGRRTGKILAGLGLIFIGLSLMADTMREHREALQVWLRPVTNPVVLLLFGIVLTALVQSSSATTSVVISLTVAGLTVGRGGNELLYIILGTNIGSCSTALLSTLGASVNARRAGIIHLLFNSIGSLIFFLILLLSPGFMAATFGRWFPAVATQIAMFHTFFNVSCALVFLPFSAWFVRLSEWIVPDRRGETREPQTYLDERMLTSSSLALSQLEKEAMRLSDIAMDAFLLSFRAFQDANTGAATKVGERIAEAERVERALVDYLVRLSARSKLSEERRVANLHSITGDIMRISEIADNLMKYTRREVEEGIAFPHEVREELDNMKERLVKLHELTKRVILEKDRALLPTLDEVEEGIDRCRRTLLDRHRERLSDGTLPPASSAVYISLVSNMERLGDHLTFAAHTEQDEKKHEEEP